MKIWKFPLEITQVQLISMPEGAKLLTAQLQYEKPTLWALVDPTSKSVQRMIVMNNTGSECWPETTAEGYIATIQTAGGQFVWHFFDGGEA